MRRIRAILVMIVVSLISTSGVWASGEADEIIDEFMAPCCFNGLLRDHHSDAALEMKQEIRDFVAEGKSAEEIRSIFVGRIGERILAEPVMEGVNYLSYWAPVLAIVAGFAAVSTVVRRQRRRAATVRDEVDARTRPGGDPDELERMIREGE